MCETLSGCLPHAPRWGRVQETSRSGGEPSRAIPAGASAVPSAGLRDRSVCA